MARKILIEFKDAFYHVMSRGLNRQNLFRCDEDFIFFLWVLNQAKEKYGFICHSYCLMHNHYHLFLQTPNANLAKTMKYINETYARYFLKKYPDRDGHVFKGRYKRKLVQQDLYSWQLSRYIHLNPVKAGLVQHPEQWRWSSYRAFIGLEPKNKFVELDWLSNQFSNDLIKSRRMIAGYTYDDIDCSWDPEDHTIEKLVLGTRSFFNAIVDKYIASNEEDELEFSIFKTIDPAEILLKVEELSVDRKLKDKLFIYYLREHTSLSLREIGDLVDKKPKTVSKSYTRTKELLANKEMDYLLSLN